MNLDKSLKERTRELVSIAWHIFSMKVGNQLIDINKEASMQLQYSFILKSLLPIIIIRQGESLDLELETSINDGTKNREVDILIYGNSSEGEFKIAIELKCYRKTASSGGNRGATDIFMKDVYEDLNLLERYMENNSADIGISLIMNDYKHFINPAKKEGKCWNYDISQGTIIEGGKKIDIPVGGKPVSIDLKKGYKFKWNKINSFWFCEIEGK